MKNFIGADVSKDTIDIAYCCNSEEKKPQYKSLRVKNEPEALRNWTKSLIASAEQEKTSWFVVLEATGNYCLWLMHLLQEAGIEFAVISPTESAGFGRASGQHNKTDGLDARRLAQFGLRMNPKPFKFPEREVLERKLLISQLNSLEKIKNSLLNQIHAQRLNPIVGDCPLPAEVVLQTVCEQIELIKNQLFTFDNKEFKRLLALLTSIPGIGKKTAMEMIFITNFFANFSSAKQLACYLGVVPKLNQSGTFKGKARIGGGVRCLRKLLFCCARATLRCRDPYFRDLFDRLTAKGKNGKVALTAIMHKLARTVFGVVASGKRFESPTRKASSDAASRSC